MAAYGEIKPYLPLQGCIFTRMFLSDPSWVYRISGYALIAWIWGFWEGFNYVVISQKINDRYPSKNPLFNRGAIACGVLCILIHGMIGSDLKTILEALTTFLLIYGMLVIRDRYHNAWGAVFIFLLFWNEI